jgi:hypothetical protein
VRLISAELISSLKGATDACFRLGGGVTSFALLTRVGVSTLSKYASNGEDHEETLVPVDVAIEADQRAGTPVIVSEMARQLGFRLEPLERRAADADGLSEEDVLKIMDKAHDLFRLARLAFADGKLDALERRDLGQQLRRVIRACECVLSRLEAV